jgi:hypothetical protein
MLAADAFAAGGDICNVLGWPRSALARLLHARHVYSGESRPPQTTV